MCSNIRLSRSTSIKPGTTATYKTSHLSLSTAVFDEQGVFGLKNGIFYNVRSDKLSINNATWFGQDLHRGVISLIGFTEGPHEFALFNNQPMYAAILYSDAKEFALITENSAGIVGKYHRRMPVLIDNNYHSMAAWFLEGRITHLDPCVLKRA